MDTALTVKTLRQQSWQLMLKEQSRSGLSVRDWCALNDISTKTFYYRRKKVQAMFLEAAKQATFEELIPPRDANTCHEETPQASQISFMPQLTISLRDTVIGIDHNTPQKLLAETLEMIRNA